MATRPLLALALTLFACQPGMSTATSTPDASTPEPAVPSTGAEDASAPEATPESGEPPIAAGPPAPTEPAEPYDPYGPVSAELTQRFSDIESDPRPDELTRNSHYWISNEHSQWLWYPRVDGVGGAYIGVGTDQNYMIAGWAKSDFIVMMDFDQAIVNLHAVYAAMFEKAETPAAFLDLWEEEREAEVRGWLETRYADDERKDDIIRAHKIARKLVRARLRRLARRYEERGIPTFVSDQAQYDHIRQLSANGRIVAVRGDLTADLTMQQIGDALADSKLELGVLYLSNAEQYFEYEAGFRRNILALPFQDDAVILRTLGWNSHGFVEGEEYHYNLQAAANFVGWLRQSRVRSSGRLLRQKTATETPGYSILDKAPEVSSEPPEIADFARPRPTP